MKGLPTGQAEVAFDGPSTMKWGQSGVEDGSDQRSSFTIAVGFSYLLLLQGSLIMQRLFFPAVVFGIPSTVFEYLFFLS